MIIEDYIINYLVFYILLEIYEVQWQKAKTMAGMLARMYQYYKKSVFIFLLMHPTFFFVSGFMILSDYNVYAIILFVLKSLDIVTKLLLIKQLFIERDISEELSYALLAPLKEYVAYVGVFVYTPFVYMALV
jgi:hypothetical protein